jgi:SH3-like domain-containing protein
MRRGVLRTFAFALSAAAVISSPPVLALDFRAVAEPAAILYDGPSVKATRLYVVNRGYPLEVVVTVQGWVKVRDANGALTWVESKQLTEKRTVMVKVASAPVRQKPEDAAPVAFHAQQNVVLELVEVSGPWIQVRHPEAGSGYVRAQQVWGV